MNIQTINPTTGAPLQNYAIMSSDEVNHVIESVHQVYLRWQTISVGERCMIMLRLADVLLINKDRYAQLMAKEMGKPLANGRSEIEKCAKLCCYYADYAQEFLKPELVKTEMQKSCIVYQPLGVLLAIMPWNFPFWQVFRCCVANLIVGNAILLKHAPIVTGCALAIEDAFNQAGFPAHLFKVLVIDDEQTQHVIAHPHVMGVSLTGSERAGKVVAAEAGKHLKKVSLELGGSDPYLILKDADLGLAAQMCVRSRLANSGQVCIAAKRFIVVESVQEAFMRQVMAKIDDYILGDPMDANVTLGPLARDDLRVHLHKQVLECVAQGAVLLRGGEIPKGAGFFYPITILGDVKKGMPAYEDELFGPVIAFITAKDEADAIEKANDTRYGLSAAVFTKDIPRGEKIAEQLQAGTCYVNNLVSSDPRLPFGGVKSSGFGRELGKIGMREFCNVKTIVIA
jgi:succinate-semialdehyde dehydrogenase / glutarate-semialdehyde dehydrogenase